MGFWCPKSVSRFEAQGLAHGGSRYINHISLRILEEMGMSCHGRQPGLTSNRPLGTMVGDRSLVWIDQGSVLEGYFYVKCFLKILTFYISSSCWSTYSTNICSNPTLGSVLFWELESQRDRVLMLLRLEVPPWRAQETLCLKTSKTGPGI